MLIPSLEVEYFNPVVADWTPEFKALEDAAKAKARVQLYVITPLQRGFYSLVEIMHAIAGPDQPEHVFVYFMLVDNDGVAFDDAQQRSIKASIEIIQSYQNATVLYSLTEVADALNKYLKEPV
jgi:hypothetical protein